MELRLPLPARALGVTGEGSKGGSQPACEGLVVFGSQGHCGIEQWHRCETSALSGVAWMVLRQLLNMNRCVFLFLLLITWEQGEDVFNEAPEHRQITHSLQVLITGETLPHIGLCISGSPGTIPDKAYLTPRSSARLEEQLRANLTSHGGFVVREGRTLPYPG